MEADDIRETAEKRIKKLIWKALKKKKLLEFIRDTIKDETNRLFWNWENRHTSNNDRVKRLVLDVASLKQSPLRIDNTTLKKFVLQSIGETFQAWQTYHTDTELRIVNLEVNMSNVKKEMKKLRGNDEIHIQD